MKQVGRGQVPNVLEMLDYFEDSKYFYTVLEYAPLGDLYGYARKNWSI